VALPRQSGLYSGNLEGIGWTDRSAVSRMVGGWARARTVRGPDGSVRLDGPASQAGMPWERGCRRTADVPARSGRERGTGWTRPGSWSAHRRVLDSSAPSTGRGHLRIPSKDAVATSALVRASPDGPSAPSSPSSPELSPWGQAAVARGSPACPPSSPSLPPQVTGIDLASPPGGRPRGRRPLHVMHWSRWRRERQHQARACHYRRRGERPPD
jgi:hypothetical protein